MPLPQRLFFQKHLQDFFKQIHAVAALFQQLIVLAELCGRF